MSQSTAKNTTKASKEDVFKVPKHNMDSLSVHLDDIVQVLETKLYKPEEYIITKGKQSQSIFFIVRGIVDIYVTDPNFGKVEGEYFQADEGSIVGEIGVLLDVPRTAYVLAKNYTVLS